MDPYVGAFAQVAAAIQIPGEQGLGFGRGGAPAMVPAEAHRSGAERADTQARQALSDVRVQLDAFLLNGDV
jgi:hypothetical protein